MVFLGGMERMEKMCHVPIDRAGLSIQRIPISGLEFMDSIVGAVPK